MFMQKINLKLRTKITLLMIVVELISITTVAFIAGHWAIKNIELSEEISIMNTAKIISHSKIVREALSKKDQRGIIQKYIEEILQSTNNIEIIVVADMNGIRYGHPVPERVGKKFVGGDEVKVVQKGESYISEAVGTLGREIRAFAPIDDMENKQIGFVMVGILIQSLQKAKAESLYNIFLISLIGLLIGITVALLLSAKIKNELLGLEPKEITKLYIEKKGMLDAIHEGIIAINQDLEITLVNNSAMEILGLKEKDINDIIGKKIKTVFPTSKLVEVFRTGVPEYNREQVINNTIILTNRVPIRYQDKIVGAIATFRDKTKITKLAEEITGVKQIIEALRANTHEFMNKLHVILGLIQLEEYEEAKKYIINESEKQQQIVSLIIKKINDPTIAALILGKLSRAKELGVNINILEESYLEKHVGRINSNILTTIIGNLIENAMESVAKSNKNNRNIDLLIQELDEIIKIEVLDTGVGIREEHIRLIFKRGFTTKEGNTGVGLFLVNEIVNTLNGRIEVESKLNQYTKFSIIIPKHV
jgi:sensor histidine kinase regulating citrate/malate metabolism